MDKLNKISNDVLALFKDAFNPTQIDRRWGEGQRIFHARGAEVWVVLNDDGSVGVDAYVYGSTFGELTTRRPKAARALVEAAINAAKES